MRLIIPLPKLQIDTLPFWNCCCSVTKLCPTLCGHMDCSPHGLQLIRIPCPSSPTVCSNSCPLSQWCHPTSSCSVAPFSFCLQSFPASGSFSSVQSLSRVQVFATLWTAAHQASLSITDFQSLLRLMSIKSVMPSNHLILCHALLLLPSVFHSIRVFPNESVFHIKWSKYWSFSFSISPSNEYLGLISFRIDWLDLLAVHGSLKSLLQHHSAKASILWHSAFSMVQFLHPYMTTVKTIALIRQTFVGKVMSLFFNMLPRFVIAFLPRSKSLLISWLQSPSAVILEPKKIKSVLSDYLTLWQKFSQESWY